MMLDTFALWIGRAFLMLVGLGAITAILYFVIEIYWRQVMRPMLLVKDFWEWRKQRRKDSQ